MTASVRNWPRMAPRGAPIALRIPISRVRSVTVTSMMFMIPMPPTRRLMAATAPSRTVKVWLVEALVASRESSLIRVKGRLAALVWLAEARMSAASLLGVVDALGGRGLDDQLVEAGHVPGQLVLGRGVGDDGDVVEVRRRRSTPCSPAPRPPGTGWNRS